jgi:hypothetical protein
MRVKLQLVICNDPDQEETVTDVITFRRCFRAVDMLPSH